MEGKKMQLKRENEQGEKIRTLGPGEEEEE